MSLWSVPDIPLPLTPSQQRWAPGTQCMTKCENSRPKPGELAFRKGDMVTILEACEVRGELEGRGCTLGVPGQTPPSSFPPSVPFLYRTRAGTEPSTTAVGRKGCWQPLLCDSGRPSPQTPSSASCREWHPSGLHEGPSHLSPCLTQHPLHTPPQMVSWQDLRPGSYTAAAAARGRVVSCEGISPSPWRLCPVCQFWP